MSPIKVLPDHVINKIAAGEVVERPASVVKELIENSIDAGATEIIVDIEQAGRRMIRITDNGCGMSRDDAAMAFQRHATSKITTDTDLEAVTTMGFRGEALASIASVSHIRMVTNEQGSSTGSLIEIEGGIFKSVLDAASAPGTALDIGHLFYNTPARLKFLKSPATEFSHIVTAVARQALAHPGIRFRLTHNNKPVLDLPGSLDLPERVFQLYGNDLSENLVGFSGGRDGVRVAGLLSRPGYSRADKTYQEFYVNGRAIRNASLSHAVYGAYGDMLMRDRHPAAFVFIEVDPALVDVNVHPAKAEVRFRNQSQMHDLVRDAIRNGLRTRPRPDAEDFSGRMRTELVREAASAYTPATEFGGWSTVPAAGSASPQLPFASDERNISALSSPKLLIPLAQVHDSFILAHLRDGIGIVDQHAAHERVLFEKLQDQFEGRAAAVQQLLVPVQLDLGPAQAGLLREHLPALADVGLVVEDFGGGSFVIKAVPALIVGSDYKTLLLDILDEVNVHGKSRKFHERRDAILSVMACHPAIKVNRKLEIPEMEKLLADLLACRMPHTCPHGRPTIIRFSLHELKKMFKRV